MAPKRSSSDVKSRSSKKKKTEVKVVKGKVEKKRNKKSSAKEQKQVKSTIKGSKSISAKPKQTKTGKITKKPTARGGALKSAPGAESWLCDLLTDTDWKNRLTHCFQTDAFRQMETWLSDEYKKAEVFPPKELIFNAFNITKFNKVKVVILGQDPYHDNGQAHGMSFSVPKGIAVPPSLRNIYKELVKDYPSFVTPDHGCLESWANQGVLLLNAALTVRAHEANSHARCGWWKFTDDVIRTISDHATHTVFILWGGFAHKKEALIDKTKHTVIKTAHPSPLSFNKFNGCKCFSQVNKALSEHSQTPIDWNIK